MQHPSITDITHKNIGYITRVVSVTLESLGELIGVDIEGMKYFMNPPSSPDKQERWMNIARKLGGLLKIPESYVIYHDIEKENLLPPETIAYLRMTL